MHIARHVDDHSRIEFDELVQESFVASLTFQLKGLGFIPSSEGQLSKRSDQAASGRLGIFCPQYRLKTMH